MKLSQLLIYFIGEIYVIFSVVYSYSKLCSIDFKLKKFFRKTILIVIFSFIMLLNNLYNLTQFRTIMSFIIMILVNYFYYKDDLKHILINTLIFIFVITLLELLFSPILITGFKTIENFNSTGTLTKFLFTIFVFSVTNIFFSKCIKSTKKLISKLKTFSRKYFSLELLLIIIIIILNIMTFLLGNNMKNIIYIISIIIGLIYIVVTVITIVKSKYIIDQLKSKNKKLSISYKSYSEALDQFRELKHNLKNDLFSIKSILPDNKQIYLNNIIYKYNNKYEWLNDLANLPEGLEGIIYLKKHEAENEKLDFIVNYNSKNKILDRDFLDICDILGIIIDNAIEACKNAKSKIILLNVEDQDNKIVMKVINKYNNSINLEKIGTKNYSTKKIKSGLGLNYISKLKNKNISTKMEIINDLFITHIFYQVKKRTKN